MNFSQKETKQEAYKLEVKEVSKSFDRMKVVDQVSITMNKGEFVAVLGPSGCGKSTLFNMIAGLLQPDEGNIIIDGEIATQKTGKVAYMYQKDLLLPWKKIIDNVALPLVVKGMAKKQAQDKVRPYFKTFGLEGFENHYPSELSGGMKQRAALMRTYMFSEDIILLDEPFGGLDAITKHKMQTWLLDILKQLEASILLITHDVDEAILLADRIYVLTDRPGRIKAEFSVDFSKNNHEEVSVSEEFNQLKKQIISLL